VAPRAEPDAASVTASSPNPRRIICLGCDYGVLVLVDGDGDGEGEGDGEGLGDGDGDTDVVGSTAQCHKVSPEYQH